MTQNLRKLVLEIESNDDLEWVNVHADYEEYTTRLIYWYPQIALASSLSILRNVYFFLGIGYQFYTHIMMVIMHRPIST